MSVMQMLELNDKYLLVIGHLNNVQVYKRLTDEETGE